MYYKEIKLIYLASRFPSINNFAPAFSNLSFMSRGRIIIWSGPIRSVMSVNNRAVAARTIAFWWLDNRNRERLVLSREETFSESQLGIVDLPGSPKYDDTDGFMRRKILHHLIQSCVTVRSKKSICIGRSVEQWSNYVVQILWGENK